MSTSTPRDPRAARPARLNGWKEIAGYLDRGVRTVQRWEKTLALPIRRIGTGRGEVVYALPDELDAWRAAADSTKDLSETLAEREADDGASTAFPSIGDSGPAAARANGEAIDRAQPSGVEALPTGKVPAGEARGRRRLAVPLLAVAGLAALFFGWLSWSAPAPEPSDYVWDVDTLRVIDAKGRELWSDRFDKLMSSEMFGERKRALGRDPVVIQDLDGDGSREVVFAYRPGKPDSHSEVRGYTASGRPLFRVRFDGTIHFGDTRYSPPWGAYRLFVTRAREGGKWLWVAWNHETGEFPTLLQRISLDGKVEAAVWSAGYVESVQVADVGGRPSVLVGAANNDHRGGGLAVFDVDAVAGSLPAETWDKTCRDCQPGGPRKLLVFPQLDVLGLLGGIPSVVSTAPQATGEFRVYVDQGALTPAANGLEWGGTIAYDLSPGLTPVLAEFTAGYISAHDRHHGKGLLNHPFGDADRAAAWPVLVWENGVWTKVMGSTDR